MEIQKKQSIEHRKPRIDVTISRDAIKFINWLIGEQGNLSQFIDEQVKAHHRFEEWKISIRGNKKESTMSGRKKIVSAIVEMASANGSVAVQTLTYLMQTFLQEQGDNATVQEAIQHLDTIADTARSIADEPDGWIFGRGALFIDVAKGFGKLT